jgi:hypothetical protein
LYEACFSSGEARPSAKASAATCVASAISTPAELKPRVTPYWYHEVVTSLATSGSVTEELVSCTNSR